MNDPATFPDASLSVEANQGPAPADLERRVQRLEETIDSLQDTQALEDRVVERVTRHLAPTHAAKVIALSAPPAQANSKWVDPPPGPPGSAHSWLLIDLLNDARILPAMLLDRRFRMAWTTHLVVWPFLVLILLSHYWFPLAWILGVGTYFDKLVDLLLAFCIYKALSREARRYREMLRGLG